uniref:Serine hydrolase domain-containing protein n=1 Tax=Aegilops tauschii subsp. strangulata TaxID=200361 RepID=A0A453C373_AEGTS
DHFTPGIDRSISGQDFLKYKNFGECLAGIEELMVRQGPFDGLFGFSQVVNYFNLGSISFELRFRHQSSYSYYSDELMSSTIVIIIFRAPSCRPRLLVSSNKGWP